MNRIQHIFNDHAGAYLEAFGERIPAMQRKALAAICECRTGQRGHHLFACQQCHRYHLAKSSCGNRHCPVCQNDKAAEWVHRQQLRRLPCTYFMATFTIPEAMRSVARSNQKAVYDAMFDEAAASLRTLEKDSRFVGCDLAGFFAVLHTWGRQLQYHPHVHFVIPGGGLSKDRREWVPAHGHFLVHVKALSRMFRGKIKARFCKAGLLGLVPEEIWQQEWVVHCKAVGDGRHIMKYLGAYVFRVAISNSRIVAYDGSNVTFKYQKVGSSKYKQLSLPVFEFMRRFLQHVLPKGFVKVRHYGFLSPNCRIGIQQIAELICMFYEHLCHLPAKTKPRQKPKPLRCHHCGGLMQWIRFLAPLRLGPSP